MDKSKHHYMTFREMADQPGTRAWEKYKWVTVGDKGYWFLAKFEILQLLFSGVPGALGILLRQKFYRILFKKLGRKAVIGRATCFRQPSHISIGSGTVIDDFSRITVVGSERGEVKIGNNVFLGPFSILSSRDALVDIGDQANIGSHCRLGSMHGSLKIGRYALIGAYCYIGAGNHEMTDRLVPMAKQGSNSKGGVTIEDDVWIGANVTVLDGVRIGKGSIIGACSLVTREIPPYSIAYGVPARVKGTRKVHPIPMNREG